MVLNNQYKGESMIIDIHNHFYAPQLLDAIEKQSFSKDLWIEKDSWNRRIIVQRGTRVVTITEPMSNPEMRINDMQNAGVDMQVLSLSVPSVDFFDPIAGYDFARLSNDAIVEVCRQFPNHFSGFASVPLKDPERALQEAKRAVNELGMKGICLGSNIDGQFIDHSSFWPFFKEMEKLSVPIFIHPMTPPGSEAMQQYRLAPMIGFEMDLCLAVARIIFSGLLETYPSLTFIIAHLGGAIPYLIERIENCYKAYPECREYISQNPSVYLHKMFFDTVSFHEPALMCAYEFASAQKMVMGSDYPHVIGDLKRAVTSIKNLSIPEKEIDMILGKNIKNMLAINSG